MAGPPHRPSSQTLRDPEKIESEVLSSPASSGSHGHHHDATWLSHNIAHVLDRLFRIPGSSARFGLDPIVGLIPGVGDALGAALGSFILLEAMRLNAPRPLVLRMAGNVTVNALLGAIPIVGDIFSFLFQSNARNYALLRAWQSGEKSYPPAISGKWLAAGCVGLAVIAAGLCALAVWIISALWKWLVG
jgi:hypothetical protein